MWIPICEYLLPEGEEPIDQKETASSTLLEIERAEEMAYLEAFEQERVRMWQENLCPKCGIQMDKAEADRWRKIAGRGDYIPHTHSSHAATLRRTFQVYPLCGLG